jgi:hypothetical protein
VAARVRAEPVLGGPQQPLIALPPWDEISLPEDGLHDARVLLNATLTPPHFADWRHDYVLLLNADAGRIANLAALSELVLERDEGLARLYRLVGNMPEAVARVASVIRL